MKKVYFGKKSKIEREVEKAIDCGRPPPSKDILFLLSLLPLNVLITIFKAMLKYTFYNIKSKLFMPVSSPIVDNLRNGLSY